MLTSEAVRLPGSALAQPPKQKQVKDQGEYDLFTEVGKATDANKRLALLNTWKEKYPTTDFQEERSKYYAVTYQQLGQGAGRDRCRLLELLDLRVHES